MQNVCFFVLDSAPKIVTQCSTFSLGQVLHAVFLCAQFIRVLKFDVGRL